MGIGLGIWAAYRTQLGGGAVFGVRRCELDGVEVKHRDLGKRSRLLGTLATIRERIGQTRKTKDKAETQRALRCAESREARQSLGGDDVAALRFDLDDREAGGIPAAA